MSNWPWRIATICWCIIVWESHIKIIETFTSPLCVFSCFWMNKFHFFLLKLGYLFTDKWAMACSKAEVWGQAAKTQSSQWIYITWPKSILLTCRLFKVHNICGNKKYSDQSVLHSLVWILIVQLMCKDLFPRTIISKERKFSYPQQ